MQRQARFIFRERIILLAYFVSALSMLALFFLLGALGEGLSQAAPPPDYAELAVLAPLSGKHAELGQAALRAAQHAARALPPDLGRAAPQVIVTGYDTQDTAEGAAQAAARAALNPATAAIIGPLDARQVAAAAEMLRGQDVALITPASTAPTLRLDQYSGLYRIPAPDSLQGQAIVDFLSRELHRTDVFLLSDASSAFARAVLDDFLRAGRNRVRIVGRLDAGQTLPADLERRIADSRATVMVYLGGWQNARKVLDAGTHLPLVASDALNDPSLQSLSKNRAPIYYTSPFLSLPALPDQAALAACRQALGPITGLPFAYETAQATWLALSALARRSTRETAREAVWRNLAEARLPGLGLGGEISFEGGQMQPRLLYVYQVNPDAADWSLNPLVHFVEVKTP